MDKIAMKAVLTISYNADPGAYEDDGPFTPELVRDVDQEDFDSEPEHLIHAIGEGADYDIFVLSPGDTHPEFDLGVARAFNFLQSFATGHEGGPAIRDAAKGLEKEYMTMGANDLADKIRVVLDEYEDDPITGEELHGIITLIINTTP